MAKTAHVDDADIAAALLELARTFGDCGRLESIVRLRLLGEISGALNIDKLVDLAAMVTGPPAPAPRKPKDAERRPEERASFQLPRY